jgi:hypothetical protein
MEPKIREIVSQAVNKMSFALFCSIFSLICFLIYSCSSNSDDKNISLSTSPNKNLSISNSDKKDLYVVSIGVPTYKNHPDMDIERNQDDAEKISDVFRLNHLFANVYFITLAKHGEATNSNVEKAINQVYKKAGKNDVVLIYISSHGAKNNKGEYLLQLYDFDKENVYKTSFKAKDLIKKTEIKTIIWIDACEAGTAAKDLFNNKIDILVSSDENECANSTWYGSEFTNSLYKGLNCKADYNKDGKVSLNEITKYVVKNVSTQNAQNPIKKIPDVDLVKCRD